MNRSRGKHSSCLGRIIRFIFRFFAIVIIFNFARYIYITRNDQSVPSKTGEATFVEVAPAATTVSRTETEPGSALSADGSNQTAPKRTDYSIAPTSPLWNTYNSSLHWFYTQLTSAEKRAYSAKYDAIALGDSSLWNTSGFGLTEMETERVKFAIQNDCPELMLCKIDFVTADVLAPYSDTTFFRNRAEYITTELPACLSELDKLKSTDAWGSSDLKKEEAYEKYIARKTEYLSDRGSDEGKISIDGSVRVPSSAILYRTAVCEGFANSTQLAMRYFGIPCIYVSGKASSGGNHAWNLVRIDGEWFQYDATWNGSGKYMNLSDAEMLKKRSVSKDYTRLGFTLPACRK